VFALNIGQTLSSGEFTKEAARETGSLEEYLNVDNCLETTVKMKIASGDEQIIKHNQLSGSYQKREKTRKNNRKNKTSSYFEVLKVLRYLIHQFINFLIKQINSKWFK
jgi:hypothetical protein